MASIFDGAESFNKFAKRMEARAGKIEKNALKNFRRVVLAVGAQVIQATPVDTGHARNNWLSARNVTPGGTPNAPSKGAVAATALLTTTGIALQLNDVAHITNNVPYIRRLNAGHSKQAPAGFVEKALQAGVRAVNGFTLLD